MAIIKKTSSLGNKIIFSLEFDDSKMVLTDISVNNLSKTRMVFEIMSPKALVVSFLDTANHKILPKMQPSWSYKDVNDPELGLVRKIIGIDWRAWVD